MAVAYVTKSRNHLLRVWVYQGSIESKEYPLDSLREAENDSAWLALSHQAECYFVDDPDGLWASLRMKQLEEDHG